jgi:hypothetical protein
MSQHNPKKAANLLFGAIAGITFTTTVGLANDSNKYLCLLNICKSVLVSPDIHTSTYSL